MLVLMSQGGLISGSASSSSSLGFSFIRTNTRICELSMVSNICSSSLGLIKEMSALIPKGSMYSGMSHVCSSHSLAVFSATPSRNVKEQSPTARKNLFNHSCLSLIHHATVDEMFEDADCFLDGYLAAST